MSAKAALKAVNAAIQAKDYKGAAQQAEHILTTDTKNYQALVSILMTCSHRLTLHSHIFLAFARDKLGKVKDAEAAFDIATKIKTQDPQAWQGLIGVYRQQGGAKVTEYRHATTRLARIYQELDDKYKCQDVVDKFVDFAKSQGSRQDYKAALEIMLPDSQIYDYLEGRLPHPSHTYEAIAQITEFEEKERINKEIGERRTRLGAKIGQVTAEVRREVFKNSNIEELYAQVINWSSDDLIRRQYEEKLLQRCLEVVEVLPPGRDRDEKNAKVTKLASDMVIIKHTYKLAWDLTIDRLDPRSLGDFDINLLQEYIQYFPMSGLGQVLKVFLFSEISPYDSSKMTTHQTDDASAESEDEDDGGVNLESHLSAEDRLVLMCDGVAAAPSSLLAHRILGEYYQHLDEYESVVELMRNAKRLCNDQSSRYGVHLGNAYMHVVALLATALVFYQSPKNHQEARLLFDELLVLDPASSSALLGYGMIYEEDEDYEAAYLSLKGALKQNPGDIRVKIEHFWVKAIVTDFKEGSQDLKTCISLINEMESPAKDLLALAQFRTGMCIWNAEPSKQARKDRSGAYSYFLAALKSNLSFAPAYSMLGIYYFDYAKDRKRARKCFQKAVELSPGEIESARYLAEDFASHGEWESVEMIAQRVVNSGRVKPSPGSKRKGISWPYLALGVAQLNRQDYAQSVVSYQAALRIKPDDYNAWVGLGEGYHNLGRYIAATRAFEYAEKLEASPGMDATDKIWYLRYMLGNVKRELGDYDDAVMKYKSVLSDRPSELGVYTALLQALVDSAWAKVEKGLYGESIACALETMHIAEAALQTCTGSFNVWKALGDACAVFSWVRSRLDQFPSDLVTRILDSAIKFETENTLFSDSDGIEIGAWQEIKTHTGLERVLSSTILFHKLAVAASASDIHAQAIAYYNLGWAEHRAHECLEAHSSKKSTKYIKAAVRCFKHAIELEAKNAEFWNALGVVTSGLNPKVSQHAFIRSLYLNEISANVWTNLGALYLLQNDHQLAAEAFSRAQATDPDYAHAWIGQAFLAQLLGDANEASLLFMHAMNLSEISSTLTKKCYTQNMLDKLLKSSDDVPASDLTQSLFALRQLQTVVPEDIVYQHLLALFSERVDDLTTTIKTLESICATLETEYEVTETSYSLCRFALGKADLARSQVVAGQFQEAIDSAETALQLITDDSAIAVSTEIRQRCELSAHITHGLGQHLSGTIDMAIESLQQAVDMSSGDPGTACLLSQALWARGDAESHSRARDTLFDCIEKHPQHVQAVLLLGIIALLDDDAESLEAVSSELQTLRTKVDISTSELHDVEEVIHAIAMANDEVGDADGLASLQQAIMLRPHDSSGWCRLVEQSNDTYSRFMVLKTATRQVPPRGQVGAERLGTALAQTGVARDAQVGIVVAPWIQAGRQTLRSCVELHA